MAFTLSPNMSLPIPSVGSEPGPDYAQDVNNALTILDGHTHSPGNGTAVTSDGLNINADLSFQANNATNLRTIRLLPQGTVLAGATDLGCVYVVGADLYYNDTAGNKVRITQSGGVAGAPGSISNLTSPASASYAAGTQTFTWQSNALTPANLDAASIVLRNLTASSKGLTLNPPGSMGADIAITLPTPPAVPSFLTMSATGVMTAALPISQGLNLTNMVAKSVTTSAPAYGVMSASIGSNFQTTNAGSMTGTGISGSLVCTGRPVVLQLQPLNSSSFGAFTTFQSAGASPTGIVGLFRDGSQIATYNIGITVLGVSGSDKYTFIPVSVVAFVDVPSAGTHTYDIRIQVASGTSMTIPPSTLIAYEI